MSNFFAFQKAMKCPTCFELLISDSKNYIVTSPCGHLFHNDCVQAWLDRGNQSCPQCRTGRVSVQGVTSHGGHFACLCQGFEFYEVKKIFCYYFSKRKWKYFYTFNHFYSEKSSKRAK